jgi:putative membrane protein
MSTKFEQAVSDAGLKLPPERMDSQGRFTCNDLRSKTAADFDKEYVQAQYNGHVETVEMFRAYANSGEDARLKRFAADALPTLQAHLALVKTLRK